MLEQVTSLEQPLFVGPRVTIIDRFHCNNAEFQEYLSRLPVAAHPFLKKEIDWDNNGVDKDLNMIADSMGADWEVTLSVPLELTRTNIDDLKTKYSHEHPCLLW